MSNRTDVQLLIQDQDSILFSTDEIDRFLALTSDDIYLASALALRSVAASAALVAKLEESLNIKIDRKSVPLRLQEAADKYEKMSEGAPAFGIAERALTVFSVQDIAVNRALREQ